MFNIKQTEKKTATFVSQNLLLSSNLNFIMPHSTVGLPHSGSGTYGILVVEEVVQCQEPTALHTGMVSTD